jgi:hypothetical protein
LHHHAFPSDPPLHPARLESKRVLDRCHDLIKTTTLLLHPPLRPLKLNPLWDSHLWSNQMPASVRGKGLILVETVLPVLSRFRRLVVPQLNHDRPLKLIEKNRQ